MDEAARQAAIALGAYILEVSEMRAMQASDPEKAAIHGGVGSCGRPSLAPRLKSS